MKKSTFFYSLLISIFIITTSFSYFNFLKNKREELRNERFTQESKNIKKELESFIAIKQKSILTLAIALAQDTSLKEEIQKRKIDKQKYSTMLQTFREDTDYKNIWIQVVDKDLHSLYRSWTEDYGDSLTGVRPDLENIFKNRKNFTTISVGKYDLSIKAISPIYDDKVLIGAIEIISHFNSIGKYLEKSKIEPLFVVDKRYKEQLLHPFTKKFIDGKYYIANFDASQKKMNYLSSHWIENYFYDGYKTENSYLIVSIPIRGMSHEVLAHAIMFKKIALIDKNNTRFFMFKYISLFVFILLMIAIISTLILFIYNKKQKRYYRDIVNSTTNIVLVSKESHIEYANEMFFKYFSDYSSLEEFYKVHTCICNLFLEEEGYISKYMDGLSWIDYLITNSHQNNKVKIKVHDTILTFSIKASYLKDREEGAVVVLSDITSHEKLVNISLTDELTRTGNRRLFNKSIMHEISLANRHQQVFSLIMFDIDFFKKVNDKYGHNIGDKVLQGYTALISKELREEDMLFRVGGEEFMVLLPSTRLKDAEVIAEKLRVLVKNNTIEVSITISLGVTEYILNETKESLLQRVDTALYLSKERGRDRVSCK